jgi:hypothetical protein
MINIEEIRNDYNTKGSLPILSKSALEKFVEWQKELLKKHKTAKVLSVQKTRDGIFVVWEKPEKY